MSDSLIEKRQQQRALVLQKIYEESEGSTSKWVLLYELTDSIGLSRTEADNILDYLEERGFIWMPDERSHGHIKSEGVREYERLRTAPPQRDLQTNIVHIGGNANGPIQVGGSHNTQKVSYSSNDAVSEALLKIIEAVKVSQLDEHDRDDALHNLQQLQKLSQQEKTPGLLERAKKYFDFAQSGIKAGTEIAKVTAQYWPVIAHHFGWIVK